MNRKLVQGLIFGALAFGFAAPASAHHSFAMFDRTKTIKLSGTVKQYDWTNPHAYIWLDVVDKGTTTTWAIESASPGILVRHGWTKDTMKPGDKVDIDVNPLKDGRNGGSFVRAYFPDGTTMTTGSGAQEPGAKDN
jgi:hypothetical protein